MKNKRVILEFTLFSLWVVTTVSAETIDAPSKITAVTVFADRALVTHSVALTLPQGAHEIKIAPLPGSVEEDSVTAKGRGEAKVKIFGAKFSRKQLTLPQDEEIRALEEKLKTLQDQVKRQQNMIELLQKEREFLASIQAATSDQVGKDIVTKQPNAREVSELFNFLDQSFKANYTNTQEAEIEIRKLREEIDRLHRELSALGQGTKQEFSILVELEAEKPGKFDLEVSYRLPGATWKSQYEARTDGVKEVEWTTYGMIRQWTGEEWENVALTLSTARPSVGARMPEIFPWFLNVWAPPVTRPVFGMKEPIPAYQRSLGAGLYKEEESDVGREAPLDEVAEIARATIETQGPAVTYQLPKKETIASDGQWRKVPVTSQRLPAEFAYETTPKLSPFAYLRAKVTNKSDAFYLAGAVHVFLNGAFIGTSSIRQIAPQEELDLFLGVDERIRVERKELKDKVDVSLLPGFHGKTRTIDKEHLITLQNFTQKESVVWVHEQIPVSQRDEIKVEDVRIEPKPAEEDKEKPGVFRWKVTLPPGQKWKGKLSFRIRHPVGMQVEGL